MTRFSGGPAFDEVLALRRAPIFLRVVESPAGKWDALDHLEDEAAATETIYVYMLRRKATFMHVCIRGKGKAAGGWFAHATYDYLDDQPSDAVMRDKEQWRNWCYANRSRAAHLLKPAEKDIHQ